VTAKSDLVYAPDGTITAVRHHWTFDDMFSTFAIQGLDDKKPGGLTREDLAPLAEVNITSLKDFQFFTFARADGKKPAFNEPKDYWLEHKDGALILHFTLPLQAPVKTKQLDVEIYDSSYFVDFTFAAKDPAALVGAPAECKLATHGPREASTASSQPPNEAAFQSPDAQSNFGAQYANKISVTCP
jgi:ABC-type uncharacterized transport system substrate-binding protein